jgi:hypothetical protein
MGACQFVTKANGKTAQEAFYNAVKRAQYDHGHAGYTGTIAEKDGFVQIAVPAGKIATDFVDHLLAINDGRIDDKWGPAGCVKLGEDEWLFFGWASS